MSRVSGTRIKLLQHSSIRPAILVIAFLAGVPTSVSAAPEVTRLTPPSTLFSNGDPNPPIIARFLPGQRFDLQATIKLDAGASITQARFFVDGQPVWGPVSFYAATAPAAAGSVIATRRAYSNYSPGIHRFSIRAVQNGSQVVQATGNFEIVDLDLGNSWGYGYGNNGSKRARNVIILIGDGMGIAHRTAARLMLKGTTLGKANSPLAMDTFPNTSLIMTHSLNSIVTDSSPGAAVYANGNKSNNNQQGVFPDDTLDNFDNPRVELIGEYLSRTQGKSLGIVTTSDVFDATPGAFGTHTSNRGSGTGIIDQYLAEAVPSGLRVLMGGGRKWFLPAGAAGSVRTNSNDYVLPPDLASAWNVPTGTLNEGADMLAAFQLAGFQYAADRSEMQSAHGNRLLGLFALSNMNVAKDKIDKRRGASSIVDDYGFPDQPMLDEMTEKAIDVLNRNNRGFVLMVEAASIDKQAHNMDTERWILDTIEFDRAIAVAKRFAKNDGETLVIITADHECAGVNIIGASLVSNADLQTRAASGAGAAQLRTGVVGIYEAAGFPEYAIAPDGYPESTDPDRKMLIGYAGNADRYEDWLTNVQPLRDSQQPFNNQPPLNTYPSGPLNQDTAGNFLVTGQVTGTTAVHTASDIPLSAYGAGADEFSGVMDNTDVFFAIMEAVLGGGSGKRDGYEQHHKYHYNYNDYDKYDKNWYHYGRRW
jgi:alkaline phosphatase